MKDIRVHVVKCPDRKNPVMRYVDRENGRQVQRSTGATNEREAIKVAAKCEAELREGRYNRPAKIGWAEFRRMYEAIQAGWSSAERRMRWLRAHSVDGIEGLVAGDGGVELSLVAVRDMAAAAA